MTAGAQAASGAAGIEYASVADLARLFRARNKLRVIYGLTPAEDAE